MEQTVCLVWSFRDKLQDIPYRIDLKSTANKSGKYSYLKCNCPASNYRGGKTCKHVTALNLAVKDNSIENDERFNLTDFGRLHFKL